MYDDLLSELPNSEAELKVLICRLLPQIADKRIGDFDTFIQTDFESLEISILLARIIELLQLEPSWKSDLIDLSEGHQLRVVGRILQAALAAQHVERLFNTFIRLIDQPRFVAFEYMVAARVLIYRLDEDLKHDREAILRVLLDGADPPTGVNRFSYEIAAKEEISRVRAHDEVGGLFADAMDEFFANVQKGINRLLGPLVSEIGYRASLEIFAANRAFIEEALGPDDEIGIKELVADIEEVIHIGRKKTKERLGIRRGGGRLTNKFRWTPDNKRKFFEEVRDLPTVSGKSMWEYAFEALNNEDFNNRFIKYLRNRKEFREVPDPLFREAVNSWLKYKDSMTRIPPCEKPKAMAMKYAVHRLGFPDTKFSTLEKYFGEGKTLSKATT